MMQLFLLERTGRVCYDEFDSLAVRAVSEDQAREIACHFDADLSRNWLSSDFATCEAIPMEGDPEVIIASFNAG